MASGSMGGWSTKVLLWAVLLSRVSAAFSAWDGGEDRQSLGTIAFASVGRAHFSYDIFAVKIPETRQKEKDDESFLDGILREAKLTDGVSVNYNGQFVAERETAAVLDRLGGGADVAADSSLLIFASERGGSSRLYFNIIPKAQAREAFKISVLQKPGHESEDLSQKRQLSASNLNEKVVVTLEASLPFDGPYLFDRATVTGDSIVFVSTMEAIHSPRQSWAAVYTTNIKTRATLRLTPKGIADFSPAVSPSGEWVVAASSERHGFQGEVQELLTDLYAYKARDGSNRFLLLEHGGWPSWADDHTIFFHRQSDDGWWSVYRLSLPEGFWSSGEGNLQVTRITPAGLHAFTPAASRTGKWVAVATRRPNSEYRHVEIFDLATVSFSAVTEKISPTTHHYNPFVSPNSELVGYHRCRGNPRGEDITPLLEHVRSPLPNLGLLRVDGTFPVFSPDGSRLAFCRGLGDETVARFEEGIYVSHANGTAARIVFNGPAFAETWDKSRKGVIYASVGPIFQSRKPVHIVSMYNADGEGEPTSKALTEPGLYNDAFPSSSPDGKYIVFRSGRSGYKNLYIMDAVDGEKKSIRRLTEGAWLDTHPNWSPTGEWIAFVSNREDTTVGSFGKCAIFLIRPDGTGLRKVVESDDAGLTVHPSFSPDGKRLVFVSDLAGPSAEPVSEPHQFQPYGEVFMVNIDGSNIQRLTHNFVEDGTTSWGPRFLSAGDLGKEGDIQKCDFEDTRWLSSSNHLHSSCPYAASNIYRAPPLEC